MRKSISEHIETLNRLLDRRVIFEHEAVAKLLHDVESDIMQYGDTGQAAELIRSITQLTKLGQRELEKFVCGSDDRIFCRNVLCNPGENPPDDWQHPPAQMTAEFDYSKSPFTIVINCSDGTSFELPHDNIYVCLVLALREHFQSRPSKANGG